jgi:hypothetical protein
VAEAILTLSEALDRAQSGQLTLELEWFNICAEQAKQLSETEWKLRADWGRGLGHHQISNANEPAYALTSHADSKLQPSVGGIMTEASHRLQQAKLLASMGMATRTLALQRAMWATKRQLQAQGLKVNFFPHRELVSRAEQYLAQHREELIAEASAMVEQWHLEGFFGKRAKLTTFDQHRTP